MLAAVKETKIF